MLAAIAVGAGVLALAGWFELTQPFASASPRRGGAGTADPARLEASVRMLAETIQPRDYSHPENLDRAAAWIRASLDSAGGATFEQPYTVEGREYRNVIARFGPEAGPRVIVGAHYDTAGELPGADDNASGVAGLLELARLIGAEKDLPMRVDLVAFTLEEPPYFRTGAMGSAVHAASLAKEGVAVKAMIGLEMIGWFSDEKGSQGFPTACLKPFYPSTGNFIAVIGKVGQGSLVRKVKRGMKAGGALPVRSMTGVTLVPGVDFSDHRCYWDQGFRAVMITDTAFYRNHAYHTAADVPEALDYRRMAGVVDGVHQAVLSLIDVRPKP